MGVGKTFQVLSWLAINPQARPAVIICPSNAKYNWEEQFALHTNMACEVLVGRKSYKPSSDVLLINFEIIRDWEDALLAMNPVTLVIDESHNVKNRGMLKKDKKTGKMKVQGTARTLTCQLLSKKCKHVIGMSGTPIINRPIEFWPILNMIAPKVFSSYWDFGMRFCDPKPGWKGKGWNFSGASNLAELHALVKPFMIRRLKSEVLPELPPKQRIILPIDIDNRREYNSAKDDFLEWYRQKEGDEKAERAKKAQALVRLGALKRLTAKGKLKSAVKWIEDYLEEGGEKLVVFVYHKEIFEALAKKFPPAARGNRPGASRQDEVNRFQTDPDCPLFLGRIKADKECITLHAAKAALFIENGWTPGEHDQAEDRINRMGQMADSITAYYLHGRDTIDEYVWQMIESKRDIVEQVVDGKEAVVHGNDITRLVSALKAS